MNKIILDKRMTETWIYPIICEDRDYIEDSEQWFSFLDDECSDRRPFRIFIQIPICSEICEFCPYYKEALSGISKGKLDTFVDSLIEELRFFSKTKYFRERKVSTVCIGGGDPSALPAHYWNRIFKEINELYDVSELCGISMEGTVRNLLKPKLIECLSENKVNRISFGIQTFNPELKRKMHIQFENDEIFDLVNRLRKSTIRDYSFDMMYNMPDQTTEILHADLEQAVQLEPQYIDIHGMDVYPNTGFFDRVYGDDFKIKPSRIREAEQYGMVQDFFDHTNYKQVSSNLYSVQEEPFIGYTRYLRGYPMLGIGPSARSYVNRHSFQNVYRIDQYIALIRKRKTAANYGNIASEEDDMLRKIVFFPSMTWIDKADMVCNERAQQIINDLLKCGHVYWEGSKLKLTRKSKIYAGNISRLFYSHEQREREFENLLNKIRSQKTLDVKREV